MTHTDRRSAAEIPVKIFRQIFHWPLLLKKGVSPDLGPWVGKECFDPMDLLDDIPGQVEEFNYFQNFARNFLYDKYNPSFLLYKRKYLKEIIVFLDN